VTRLRAAVVGVGHLGRHHARILRSLPDVELVGVVDAAPGRAREVGGPLGVPGWERIEEAPSDLDAVVVAVPTAAHAEVAIPWLRRGVATLVEKPLARSTEEADRILEAAREGEGLLSVGHVERYNPAVRALRELRLSPAFVEAHRLAPFRSRSTDIGVLLDLMIHDLDLLFELVPDEIASVDAIGVSVFTDREDLVSARLRLTGGCVANLTASRVSLHPMRRIRLFSPDSYVSLDFEKRYALAIRKGPAWEAARSRLAGLEAGEAEAFLENLPEDAVTVQELVVEESEPLREELRAFLDAVRAGGPAPVPGEEGRRALAAAERIRAGMELRRW